MTQTPHHQPAAKKSDRPGLVIDTPHRDEVLVVLGENGLKLSVVAEEDVPALGLSRVQLSDSKGQPVEEMDGLLAEVRRRIAAAHGGLVPPMGKDREIGSALTPMRGGNPRVTGTIPTPAGGNPQVTGILPATFALGGLGTSGGNPQVTGLPAPGAAVGSLAFAALAGGNPRVTGTTPSPLLIDESFPVPADDAPPVLADEPERTVRVGLVDTGAMESWQVPEGGVEAWEGHASFVSHIVETACPGVDMVHKAALTGGNGRGSGWAVACAITELVAEGVDILLLPLACFTADGQPPLLIERALLAVPESILVIAAAGNQTLDEGWSALDRGPTSPAWPAALLGAKAVGAEPGGFGGPQLQPWVDAVTAEVEFVGPYFDGPVVVRRFDGEATVDSEGDVTMTHADGTETVEHFEGDVTVQAGAVVVAFDGQARWAGTSFCAAHAAGLVAAKMASTDMTAIQAWDALLDDAGDALQRPPAKAL